MVCVVQLIYEYLACFLQRSTTFHHSVKFAQITRLAVQFRIRGRQKYIIEQLQQPLEFIPSREPQRNFFLCYQSYPFTSHYKIFVTNNKETHPKFQIISSLFSLVINKCFPKVRRRRKSYNFP